MPKIQIKRVYAPPAGGDGLRILVDRVWPRGLSKGKAAIDLWAKDVAPTTALRQWFGHKPERWAEFRKRYRMELKTNPALEELAHLVKNRRVTLLFGAKDETHNQAAVLAEILNNRNAG